MNREAERKRLVERLDGMDLFLRNRASAKKSPLNEYDIGIMQEYAKVADEAARMLENAVVPPYKVGAKVYATIGSLSLPIPYAVYEVTIQRYVLATGGLVPVVKLKKGAVTYGEIHTSMDSLYDTREEAQKALEGSGEK